MLRTQLLSDISDVIVVRGPGGIGKSTYVRKVLSEKGIPVLQISFRGVRDGEKFYEGITIQIFNERIHFSHEDFFFSLRHALFNLQKGKKPVIILDDCDLQVFTDKFGNPNTKPEFNLFMGGLMKLIGDELVKIVILSDSVYEAPIFNSIKTPGNTRVNPIFYETSKEDELKKMIVESLRTTKLDDKKKKESADKLVEIYGPDLNGIKRGIEYIKENVEVDIYECNLGVSSDPLMKSLLQKDITSVRIALTYDLLLQCFESQNFSCNYNELLDNLIKNIHVDRSYSQYFWYGLKFDRREIDKCVENLKIFKKVYQKDDGMIYPCERKSIESWKRWKKNSNDIFVEAREYLKNNGIYFPSSKLIDQVLNKK